MYSVDMDALASRLYSGSGDQSQGRPATLIGAGDEQAARLYPTSPPPPQADGTTLTTQQSAAPAVPASAEPAVAGVDGQSTPKDDGNTTTPVAVVVPADIAELRKSSENAQAESLYGNTPHDAILEPAMQLRELSADVRRSIAVEWSRVVRDIGLADDDVRYVVTRAQQLAVTPLSLEAARSQVNVAMVQEFGDKANEAFKAARALAHRDPRVVAFLDKSGLGSDARMIVVLAKRAVAERSKGRLK